MKYRHKIEIQEYQTKENKLLEEYKDWVTIQSPWAKISCVGNGREQTDKVGKKELSLDYEIEIRYRPGITTAMRIKFKDKIFNVNHVVDYEERHIELHLFCTLQEEGVYNE